MAEPGVFVAAASWVEGVLLGPFATSVAVIAVAATGMRMLTGRMNLRRGATVLIGCFILFGAANIARGVMGVATRFSDAGEPGMRYAAAPPAPPPEPLVEPPPPPPADPYAGAALIR